MKKLLYPVLFLTSTACFGMTAGFKPTLTELEKIEALEKKVTELREKLDSEWALIFSDKHDKMQQLIAEIMSDAPRAQLVLKNFTSEENLPLHEQEECLMKYFFYDKISTLQLTHFFFLKKKQDKLEDLKDRFIPGYKKQTEMEKKRRNLEANQRYNEDVDADQNQF